jgi:hypothetical protein
MAQLKRQEILVRMKISKKNVRSSVVIVIQGQEKVCELDNSGERRREMMCEIVA